MKKLITMLAGAAIALGGFALPVAPALAASSAAYDAIPSTLAPNYPSQPFQAQQTNEFGDYVHLAGSDRNLESVTVTMVNWALASTPANQTFCATAGNCDSTGYFWPITVNVYANTLDANDVPATLLGTRTETVHIPWRPAGDQTCPDTGYGAGFAYRAGDGQCYNGIASNVTVDMSSLGLILPNDVIVGFAYNTQTYGTAPRGVDGPYNSLNIAVPSGNTASVGTDDSSDSVFWNTNTKGYYTNPLCAGGTFCQDTQWNPYGTVAMRIAVASPVPPPSPVPTSKDQCKMDGWKTLVDSALHSFKNQGDCVSFVATGGKNTADTHRKGH